MRFLVDTQLLIWYVTDNPQLPRRAKSKLISDDAVLFFSLASIWEVAIKSALKRAGFSVVPRLLHDSLLGSAWNQVAIRPAHTFNVLELPPLHRDPFDRMLVVQAQVEGLTLLTTDETLTRYDVALLHV